MSITTSAQAELVPIAAVINGARVARTVEPRLLLAQLLRDELGLTGTHIGCNTSQCGACAVLVNGRPVKSCTLLAVQADGADVTTVEGLAGREIDALRDAFTEEHALQCGFCTPGFLVTASTLLRDLQQPTEQEVREELHGNLCRCTGYQNIIRAVLKAAETLK